MWWYGNAAVQPPETALDYLSLLALNCTWRKCCFAVCYLAEVGGYIPCSHFLGSVWGSQIWAVRYGGMGGLAGAELLWSHWLPFTALPKLWIPEQVLHPQQTYRSAGSCFSYELGQYQSAKLGRWKSGSTLPRWQWFHSLKALQLSGPRWCHLRKSMAVFETLCSDQTVRCIRWQTKSYCSLHCSITWHL